MVRKSLKGRGVGDQLFKILNFTGMTQNPPEYEGEKHAKGYHFLGPGTNLDARRRDESKGSYTPINKLDTAAKIHDLSYEKSNKKLKNKDIDKSEFMDEIHEADTDFIESLKRIPGFDLTKTIAAKAILLKKFAEQTGILSSDEFSQSGTGICIDQLNKFKIPPDNILRKSMRGGFIQSLIPWLAPILAQMAVEGVNKLISHFSEKDKNNGLKGSGLKKINKSSKLEDKKLYAAHVLDNLKPDSQIEKIFNVLINK